MASGKSAKEREREIASAPYLLSYEAKTEGHRRAWRNTLSLERTREPECARSTERENNRAQDRAENQAGRNVRIYYNYTTAKQNKAVLE